MEYLLIEDPTAPELSFVQELYLSAFPEEERRDWNKLAVMIGKVPEMRLELITDEGKAIGLIISWAILDWCFIEHFAIDPAKRGKRYGERVIKDFMQRGKVLLEVEPPVAEDAVRRVGFYERAGMNVLPFQYRHPSYRKAGVFFPMLLMSNIQENDIELFSPVIKLIELHVYKLI